MSKIIEVVLGVVDRFMPGYKTYIMMAIGMGMCVCEYLGYSQFSQEAYMMVGFSGVMFHKMGVDRKV